MNVEEIRQLFRDNTHCVMEEVEDGIGTGWKGLPWMELTDPYYEILNKAWKSLPPMTLDDTPVKVGDFNIKLISVRLDETVDNVLGWETYCDALCVAIFEILETGDKFEVRGDNGSWGWGHLMETTLDQIKKVN